MGARYPDLARRREAECGEDIPIPDPAQELAQLAFGQVVDQAEAHKQPVTATRALPGLVHFGKSVIKTHVPRLDSQPRPR